MLEPDEVSAILRLNELGWGAKRLLESSESAATRRRTTSRRAAARRTVNPSARRRSMAKRLNWACSAADNVHAERLVHLAAMNANERRRPPHPRCQWGVHSPHCCRIHSSSVKGRSLMM